MHPLRVLSFLDLGYSLEEIGAASIIEWSRDGRALAVGYRRRGLALWTASGCKLLTLIRSNASAEAASQGPKTPTSGGAAGARGFSLCRSAASQTLAAVQSLCQYTPKSPLPSGSDAQRERSVCTLAVALQAPVCLTARVCE